jgi:hypothetical protein
LKLSSESQSERIGDAPARRVAWKCSWAQGDAGDVILTEER